MTYGATWRTVLRDIRYYMTRTARTPVGVRTRSAAAMSHSPDHAAATADFEARADLSRSFHEQLDLHGHDPLIDERAEEEGPRMAATGSNPASGSAKSASADTPRSALRHAASASATSAAVADPGSPRTDDVAVDEAFKALQALGLSLGTKHRLQKKIVELEREIKDTLRSIPKKDRLHGSFRTHEIL